MRSIGLAVLALVFLQPTTAPDLVIFNARIFTGLAAQPWVEAVAITGERITAIGSTEAVRKECGPSTRQVDASGRLIIPGINDAHLHVGAKPPATALEGAPGAAVDPTLDTVLDRLRTAAATAPPGGWIFGDVGAVVLDDPRATRILLDSVTPNNPVALSAWTGHGKLLNSRALNDLGIRESEPDPPGGFFVRLGSSNAITGLAHEYACYRIGRQICMKADPEAQTALLRATSEQALSLGITSLQIMSNWLPVADATKAAVAANVPIRVRLIDFPLSDMRSWPGPARSVTSGPLVRISGTKFVLDGTPVERLMFLRAPYADRSSSRGRSNFSAADLLGFLKAAMAAGEQPMFHAVGDGAIDMVLDALERTGAEKWQRLRPRVEHGDMLEPGHFARAKRFGVVLVQNPSHLMLREVMNQRLGDRVSRVSLLKSTLLADIPLALGSDGPINPYLNLMFATINANNPPEAITREQAVRAYTSGSAFAEMEESQKGTIAVGMLADLAMLSQDIFTVPADALPNTVSVMTVIGGRIKYERQR